MLKCHPQDKCAVGQTDSTVTAGGLSERLNLRDRHEVAQGTGPPWEQAHCLASWQLRKSTEIFHIYIYPGRFRDRNWFPPAVRVSIAQAKITSGHTSLKVFVQ